jgi:hypothetical protein
VNFTLNWNPNLPSGVVIGGDTLQHWTLPPKFVNEKVVYWSGPPECDTYDTNWDLLINTNSVNCWFVNGSSGSVASWQSLHLTNGQYVSIAAAGIFTIVKPTIDHVTNACSGVNMFTNSDSLDKVALQYTNGDNGIEMYVYVKRPDHLSGTALITQLVNRNFHWNNNIPLLPTTDVTGGYWLDAQETFASTGCPLTENGNPVNPVRLIYLNDGPLLGAPLGGFYNSADAQDDFHDYLRFQPDGGIPITIGRIDWGWHGKATYSGGAWSLVISTNYINQPDASDDSFPTWPDVYHGTSGN